MEKTIILETTLDKTINETVSDTPVMVKGTVEEWGEHEGQILVAGQTVAAKMAVSCLIEPCFGDKVLACQIGREAYILSVLERTEQTQALVRVPGVDSVKLDAGQTLELQAQKGMLVFDSLAMVSGKITQASREFIAQSEDTIEISKRKTEAIHHRIVNVSGVDVRKANQVHEEIEETWVMRARAYLSQIKEDVRMVAKRILFS